MELEECIIMFSYQKNTIICHTVDILSSLVLVSNVPKGGESEPTIKQQNSAQSTNACTASHDQCSVMF